MNQLVDIVERYRRKHRTKNLFLRDPHVVANVGKHRRRHEVAFRQGPLRQSLAAGDGAGSLLFAEAEIAAHALELLLRYQRADLRLRIEPIADPEVLAEGSDPLGEFVIDFLLDEKPCAGAAYLTGIGEHGHGGAGHGRLDVGIREHDVGGSCRQAPATPA